LAVGTGVIDANANPLQSQDHTFMYAAFNALTTVDPANPTPQPELATGWQKVSDTVTEYKLRQGVNFSNGQPFTADDVVFTYQTTMNEKLAISSLIGNIKDVSAVDPATVRITTDGPDPILESRLALMFIVPRQYYQQVGTDGFAQKPVGTGRFTIDQFVPNQSMVLKANASAWQGSPQTAEVQMTYFSDTTALLSAYQSGQLDIAHLLPTQALNQLQGQGTVVPVSNASSNVITLDTTQPPFSDVRVRQAMNLAIDVPTLIKTAVDGAGTDLKGQILGPDCFGYDSSIQSYGYDPDKAKQLLSDAGYPSGFQTEIDFLPTTQRPMQAIAGFWAKIGVTATLNQLEFAVWRNGFYNGSAQPFEKGITYSPLFDGDLVLRWPTWPPAGQQGTKTWNDDHWDQLLQQSRTQTDRQQRQATLQEMSRYLHDQTPMVLLYVAAFPTAWTEKVQDYTPRNSLAMTLDRVYKTA
jgi:peptide/nickel transport system substrate-binding protein